MSNSTTLPLRSMTQIVGRVRVGSPRRSTGTAPGQASRLVRTVNRARRHRSLCRCGDPAPASALDHSQREVFVLQVLADAAVCDPVLDGGLGPEVDDHVVAAVRGTPARD